MMPYSDGIMLDNANNYGIVKTETVFRFAPAHENFVHKNISSTDSTDPLKWVYSGDKYKARDFEDKKESRALKHTVKVTKSPEPRSKKRNKSQGKKLKRKKNKLKKCFFKVFKKGKKKSKKYIKPLILGLIAAKSLLLPIALKALVFISAKGLMMGFFSTMLASFLSLKGMFEHSHGWNRRDDTKTQVEIIQVPSKSDEHIYYDHYKRGDYIPLRKVN